MSDDEINEAQRLYADGLSSLKIAEIMHIHHQVILKCIENVRSNGYRTYTLDEHYFDAIDNPNKAYILGFLYADGNNSETHHTITMDLQYTDVDILQRIADELKSNRPLIYLQSRTQKILGREYVCKPQYRLRFCSTHLSNRLSELGVIPRKTLSLRFPTFILDNLLPHFIRGYLDGDGGLYAYTNKKNDRVHHSVIIT